MKFIIEQYAQVRIYFDSNSGYCHPQIDYAKGIFTHLRSALLQLMKIQNLEQLWNSFYRSTLTCIHFDSHWIQRSSRLPFQETLIEDTYKAAGIVRVVIMPNIVQKILTEERSAIGMTMQTKTDFTLDKKNTCIW